MTKAIILAAGRGSRLMPFTENCPKCLTEIGGRTLIERQLSVLRENNIDDIVIVTGYQAEQLTLPGTRQSHNPDWATTNMVESLFCAEAEFGNDILVCYSDIVYESRVLQAILAAPHDLSVVVDCDWLRQWSLRFDDPLSDAESLKLSDDGRILDIGNKVETLSEIEAQYIGLMRFKGLGITAIKAARDNWQSTKRMWMEKRPIERAYMTDLLMELILMGQDVHAEPIDGGWFEVDTAHDLSVASSVFVDGEIKLPV